MSIVEPLAKGTIVGPALNATISGGLAYPTATSNQSLQFPNVVIYGTANDNTTNFLVQETGVGTGNNQFTRLVSSLYRLATLSSFMLEAEHFPKDMNYRA